MVLPGTRELPEKENVADTFRLDATRSSLAIENEIRLGESPNPPDASALDGIASALVTILTSPPNVGKLPKVKPCKVIVIAAPASSDAPVVVIIIEEFTVI